MVRMKKINILVVGLLLVFSAQSQNIDKLIKEKEVRRIETILAADDMQGRRTFTPGIEKAAAFIADEFKATGLKTLNNSGSYLQSFAMVRTKFLGTSGSFDGTALDKKDIVVVTTQANLSINETSGYEKITIGKTANLMSEARKLAGLKKNALVIVDTSFAKTFSGLTRLKSNLFKSDKSVIFVLSATNPTSYSIEAKHEITEMPLANVVGVLPGKSRPDEIVIFSGHYDHLGITSKDRNGNVVADSIFNGANDDAAGTTAMMVLAKYYKAANNNERTLVFAAFTAEEVGGFGATYFSNQLDPAKVMAMFNLEMIGSESKWGKNSAFITGYDKTDMGKILQANLEGTDFTFYPDPYPAQNLFYRSDNATLARLGVAANTISTSKMDSEPNYHKASDQIETLDLDNMTRIIKAIALSARGIVSGKDTPTRVNTSDLK